MRIYTHCYKFYSEEDKHIAVNRLSIGEAELYSKEQIKKKLIYEDSELLQFEFLWLCLSCIIPTVSTDNFLTPILVSEWIFCFCRNLILHQNKK